MLPEVRPAKYQTEGLQYVTPLQRNILISSVSIELAHSRTKSRLIIRSMARIPYPPPSKFPTLSASRPPVNTIKLLSHSPSTVAHWTAVGTAHYRELQLSKRVRELTILYCAAKFQSTYEWTHHVIVSAKILTDEERNAIKGAFEGAERSGANPKQFFKEGGGQEVFDERERGLYSSS